MSSLVEGSHQSVVTPGHKFGSVTATMAGRVARAMFRLPVRVVIFRARQWLTWWLLSWSRKWWLAAALFQSRIRRSLDSYTPLRVHAPSMAGDHRLRRSIVLEAIHPEDLRKSISAIRSGRISFLGAPFPGWSRSDWLTDWRVGRSWPVDPRRSWDFYETRSEAYDVKYPWEVSRFEWMAQAWIAATGLDDASDLVEWTRRRLNSWSAQNPFGETPNWYPMECAVRTINLVIVHDLVKIIWIS